MEIYVARSVSYMDAQGIRRLLETVMQTPHRDPEATFLNDPGTFVAARGTAIYGFVDGFITSIFSNGQTIRRLEVDLLAVDPGFRQRNIGRRLINALLQSTHPIIRHYDYARALVATDNTPMHRTMAACSFKRQPDVCGLYVSSGGLAEGYQETPADAHIIPVRTLTYSGLWLEGVISRDLVRVAWQRQHDDQQDLVGAVIPDADVYGRTIVQDMGFELIGKYHWWHYHR